MAPKPPPKPAPKVTVNPANPGGKYVPASAGGGTVAATSSAKYTPSPVSSLGPLAVQIVPGASYQTPGAENYQPDDPSQLLVALAQHLGINPQQYGSDLENEVATKLGQKYGILTGPPPVGPAGAPGKKGAPAKKGAPQKGGPGILGEVESGVDRVDKDVAGPLAGILAPGATIGAAAITGKNPESVEGPGKGAKPQPAKGGAKQDEPVAPPPVASGPNNVGNLSTQIFHAVAAHLGADGTKDPISAIAERLGVKQDTPTGFTPAQTKNESVAEVYSGFTKALGAKDKNSQAFIQGEVKKLEGAGYLDSSEANDPAKIEDAYKRLLTDAVTTKKPLQAVIAEKTTTNQNAVNAGGTSEAVAYVQQEADSLGVGLTPDEITGIANQFSAEAGGNGLSSVADQVREAVIKQYDPTNPNNPPGLATSIATGIQGTANDFQVPMSQGAIGNYVKNALNQGATDATAAVDQAKQTIQQQAAGLYPTLAPQILAGTDVKTLTDPYMQVAQTYLGVPAASLQTDDPSGKWSKFLQGGRDPSGAPSMMTLDQWKKTIMQDPQYGFDKTQGAHNMVADFATSLLNAFGKVNTGAGTDFSQYSGTPGSANSD